MSAHLIERHFAKIGARAKVAADPNRFGGSVSIDVGQDRQGEFFDISVGQTQDLSVVDAQPRIRHLLLMLEQADGKHKFLCGHDERHWFVAALPEPVSISNVWTAFEALKPLEVRKRQVELQVKPGRWHRRRNEAFVRQGEWFFVLAPASFRPHVKRILYDEPLQRGLGKPHICDELLRHGGELVCVSRLRPLGVSEAEYRQLIREPELRRLHWTLRRRNPLVFVRGKVRHADHKTVVLRGWHQVLMNTETQSAAMRHVAFID